MKECGISFFSNLYLLSYTRIIVKLQRFLCDAKRFCILKTHISAATSCGGYIVKSKTAQKKPLAQLYIRSSSPVLSKCLTLRRFPFRDFFRLTSDFRQSFLRSKQGKNFDRLIDTCRRFFVAVKLGVERFLNSSLDKIIMRERRLLCKQSPHVPRQPDGRLILVHKGY